MAREKKRRQYRSGGVHQRKDGRWTATFEDGFTTSGARKRVAVYGSTETEVKAKLKEKLRQRSELGEVSTQDARTTVKAWSTEWLEMTRLKTRPKPWATDRSTINRWVVPTIGHLRLEALTPAHVRSVLTAQRAAGLSTSTMRRTHATMTSLLTAAIAEGHPVTRRCLEAVDRPEKAVNDRAAMTIPEALAVLQVASYLPHGSRWAMAFLHGMRQGECLGLTWDAVNLDAGFVVVQWELQAVPYIDRSNKALGHRLPDGLDHRHLVDTFHLLPPKTKTGFRVIPLVAAMREALTDWREVAPENPWGLVWPTNKGRPTNEKMDREEWHAIQGGAGIGHPSGRYYHPHELRHGTATEMLNAGVGAHEITSLMGHSSIITSRGYMHPDARTGLATLETLAAKFGMTPRAIEG